MDTFVGLLLLLFGAGLGTYAYITPDFEPDVKFYAQMAICCFGPILIWWSDVVKFFSSKGEAEVDSKPVAPDHKDHNHSDGTCDICDYCEKDFHCLSYLKNRAREIESKEALDLVIKLNTLLFTGKHVKDQ
jgi:hypothetical protein